MSIRTSRIVTATIVVLIAVSGCTSEAQEGRPATAADSVPPSVQTSPRYLEGVVSIVVERPEQVPGERITGNFDRSGRRLLDESVGWVSRITITNVSGGDLAGFIPDFELRTAGGGHSDVSMIGGDLDIPACRHIGAPDSFDRKGAKWVACEVDASSDAVALSEVHYTEKPYGTAHPTFYVDGVDRKFNKHYGLGALVWQ